MNELEGKIVSQVLMNDDNTVIVFKTDTGEQIVYEAQGDCCSESWFSGIVGLGSLLGQQVIEVTERPEIGDLKSERQEFDILYGYFIKTKDGVIEIEFRNASNGYYGGWCERWSGVLDTMTLHGVTGDF